MTHKRKTVSAAFALLLILAVGIFVLNEDAQPNRPVEPTSPAGPIGPVSPVPPPAPGGPGSSAPLARFDPAKHPSASPGAHAAYHARRRELLFQRRGPAKLQQILDGLNVQSMLGPYIGDTVRWEILEAIPRLRELAKDPDDTIARMAMDALARLGDQEAIGFLLAKANESDQGRWSGLPIRFFSECRSPDLENRLLAQWKVLPEKGGRSDLFYLVILAEYANTAAVPAAVDWLNGKWLGYPAPETLLALAETEDPRLREPMEKSYLAAKSLNTKMVAATLLARLGDLEKQAEVETAIRRAIALSMPGSDGTIRPSSERVKTAQDHADYSAWRNHTGRLKEDCRLRLLDETFRDGRDGNLWNHALAELARKPSPEARAVLWKYAPKIIAGEPPFEKGNMKVTAGKALILYADAKSEEFARQLLYPPVEFECMKFLAETRGYDGVFVLPLQF